jgi:flagellum-specific ATP synthase
MRDIVSDDHQELAGRLRETLAVYRQAEDLINIGAYVKGSNPKIDYALSRIDAINRFLRQGMKDKVTMETTLDELEGLLQGRRQPRED